VRQKLLVKSVNRLLGADERAFQGVYMWTRNERAYIASGLLFILVVAGATLAGVEQWPVRIMIGLIGAYPAMNALTTYRALAHTTTGHVLCKASRFRSVATEVLPSPDFATIVPTGGTMLATEWQIDGVVYTVPKSYERQIQAIAMILAGDQLEAEQNS